LCGSHVLTKYNVADEACVVHRLYPRRQSSHIRKGAYWYCCCCLVEAKKQNQKTIFDVRHRADAKDDIIRLISKKVTNASRQQTRLSFCLSELYSHTTHAAMADRRRINGPPSGTAPPVYASTLSPSEQQSQRPRRTRASNQLRKICTFA